MSFITFPSYFTIQQGNLSIVGNTAGLQSTGANSFLAGQNAGSHSTSSDLIVIGVNSLDAGVTDPNANYTTVVGVNSLSAAINFSGTWPGPSDAFGGLIMPVNQSVPSSVLIGYNIAPGLNIPSGSSGITGANVIIGIDACSNVDHITLFNTNVIIGYAAYQCASATLAQDCYENVIIGAQACSNGGPAGFGQVAQNVVIGYQAAQNLAGQSEQNVIIGSGAGANILTQATLNVLVGYGANLNTPLSAVTNTTIVGALSQLLGTGANNSSTLLGAQINIGGNTGSGLILIGAGASSASGTPIANANDQFLVETFYSATQRTLLYGLLNSGNLVVGQSRQGTNRDFGGVGATNVLKLLTGTAGGSAPLGGGYFTYSGTVLSFIGISGVAVPIATT